MAYGPDDDINSPWGRRRARELTAQVACSVDGHHYIKGAKGARPNRTDGAFCRPGNVSLSTKVALDQLAFFAATTASEVVPKATDEVPHPKGVLTTFVCGGNYARIGKPPFSPGQDLFDYLKDQVPGDPGQCYTKAGLTPRRVVDGSHGHPYVWGQSCDGWRHFDCLGLVDFAVWKLRSIKDPETRTVKQWASKFNDVKATHITDNSDVMNADLVSQSEHDFHHIGMIYLADDRPFVVQAEQTSKGVTTGTPYEAGKWSGGRWRLPDSFFRDDADAAELPDAVYNPGGSLWSRVG